MKKILYGVCGIGNGHTQQQLPLIEHFSKSSKIVIFSYDSSFSFYSKYYKDNPNITILEVAVPFYVGNRDGIDFEATEKLPSNKRDYKGINGKAFADVERIIGIPDIVITDYEPICAEFSYKHQVPLITLDQQSKYLMGEFPRDLHGQTYADEVARLKMFFPMASVRIACSFFKVAKKNNGEDVLILPPIIKDSVLAISNDPKKPISLLVYFSSQKEFPQALSEISSIFSKIPLIQFHVFAPNIDDFVECENTHFYKYGDSRFSEVLRDCSGVISTAGHTLLAEAMYLGIPVYAIPLSVYEQQMNAEVIGVNEFGVRSETINERALNDFISNLDRFRHNIKEDKYILMRANGRDEIIANINKYLIG